VTLKKGVFGDLQRLGMKRSRLESPGEGCFQKRKAVVLQENSRMRIVDVDFFQKAMLLNFAKTVMAGRGELFLGGPKTELLSKKIGVP